MHPEALRVIDDHLFGWFFFAGGRTTEVCGDTDDDVDGFGGEWMDGHVCVYACVAEDQVRTRVGGK